MMLLWGSITLSTLGVVVMAMLGQQMRSAWILGTLVQAAWVPYDVLTKQYGFLITTAVCIPLYMIGYRKAT